MNSKRFVLVMCLLISGIFSAIAQEMSGDAILKASDDKLLPPSCSYTLTLETVEEDGSKKVNVLDGFKKGNSRNVMLVKKPDKVKGSVHMRKELVIWSWYVTDQKLVKEAYASTFMGSLLNYGDVMATELSYDYDVIKTETKDKLYVLTLKPKEGHEGYAKVVVSVNKDTMWPEKREYYALSGEQMKTCDIVKLERKKEQTTYMEQKYYEPLKNRYSVAIYADIKYKKESDIPETYFNENQIKYLGG